MVPFIGLLSQDEFPGQGYENPVICPARRRFLLVSMTYICDILNKRLLFNVSVCDTRHGIPRPDYLEWNHFLAEWGLCCQMTECDYKMDKFSDSFCWHFLSDAIRMEKRVTISLHLLRIAKMRLRLPKEWNYRFGSRWIYTSKMLYSSSFRDWHAS